MIEIETLCIWPLKMEAQSENKNPSHFSTKMDHENESSQNVKPKTQTGCCANCSVILSPGALRFTQIMFVTTIGKKTENLVSLADVLYLIYEPFLKSHRPDFELCAPCCQLMCQMYQVHCQFKNKANPNSYLKKILKSNQTKTRRIQEGGATSGVHDGSRRSIALNMTMVRFCDNKEMSVVGEQLTEFEFADAGADVISDRDLDSVEDLNTPVNSLHDELDSDTGSAVFEDAGSENELTRNENDTETVVKSEQTKIKRTRNNNDGKGKDEPVVKRMRKDRNRIERISIVKRRIRRTLNYIRYNSAQALRDNKGSSKYENVLSYDPPESFVAEDEDKSFHDLSCRLYSGPCSEENCTEIFNRVFMTGVDTHFKSAHQKRVQFFVVCHICNKDLPIYPRSRLRNESQVTAVQAHMKIHDGDYDQNLNELDKMNSSSLKTKCGLRLSRDVFAGKYFI